MTYLWSYSLHFHTYKMGSIISSSAIVMRNYIKYTLHYPTHSNFPRMIPPPHAFLLPWTLHLTIAASQRIMVLNGAENGTSGFHPDYIAGLSI